MATYRRPVCQLGFAGSDARAPPDGQITQSCQSLPVKIFRFTRILIYGINPPSCPAEGRCASSRFRWGRMRWTLRRQAGLACRTRRSRRTVKSCGPGAATLALRRRRLSRRQRGQERPLPGESTYKPPNIARGKPGCLGCTCQIRVRSCRYPLHTVLRAQSAPGFPCASLPRRGATRCKNPDISRRGNASACLTCRGLSTDAIAAS